MDQTNTEARDPQARSEVRDGMRIDWDAPLPMDDGLVLRADVFRPIEDGQYPVILSYGPYAKGLAFQEGYKGNWARLTKAAPEVLYLRGSPVITQLAST